MFNEIRDLAEDLLPYDKVRTVCPMCGGGSTRETCMSVEKADETVLYCCHRASCGAKGIIKNNWNFTEDTVSNNTSLVINPITSLPRIPIDLEELPSDILGYILNTYNIDQGTLQEFGIQWQSSTDSLYIPCTNGYITRTLSKPKTVRNYGVELGWSSFEDYPGPLYLVEDVLSGMAVSQAGYHVIALLGTHLTPPAIDIILGLEAEGMIEEIRVCLDADATPKAIKIADQLTEYSMAECGAIPLGKDIKDMDSEERSEFFELEV